MLRNRFGSIRLISLILYFCCSIFAQGPLPIRQFQQKPKLVVLLVIDQFRADYLTRFQDRFLPAKGAKGSIGGFQYLVEKGAWFPQAQYDLLQNMTGPGHATLLTGAYPYLTGIPNNEWYDKERKAPVYCVEDRSIQWFGGSPDEHAGSSPRNLIGSTLGDELKMVSASSRVVSIALKDRAAILMGGHRADAVIWMDPFRFQWTSTPFYFENGELPEWVRVVNSGLAAKKHTLVAGSPELPKLPSLGFFPNQITWGEKIAQSTPAGLVLTEQMAEKAIDALKMGQRKNTDLLAVSFSSHDYAGHSYGPNSPAMEEMTTADDAILSRFLNFLQKKVPGGLKNVLLVLTADHGVAPNPEWTRLGRMDAGRLDEANLRDHLNKTLAEKYGKVDGNWVLQVKEMHVYLNPRAVVQRGVESKAIEDAVKAELLATGAVLVAFTLTDFEMDRLPPGILRRQIANSYVPGRSGDVVGILKPFYISSDKTAHHQTGYAYDRTVPLILLGANVKRGVYATPAEPIDIAPTLAFFMGIVPPSQSHGRILSEITGQ